eukprot:COSAG01_NODE_20573_length_947_cov_1.707547_1_plen_110_part_00
MIVSQVVEHGKSSAVFLMCHSHSARSSAPPHHDPHGLHAVAGSAAVTDRGAVAVLSVATGLAFAASSAVVAGSSSSQPQRGHYSIPGSARTVQRIGQEIVAVCMLRTAL